MSNDPNIKRGTELFTKKIQEAGLGNLGELFIQEFEGQVGIMPVDGLYAAKRLADACIQAAPFAPGMENDALFAYILEIYGGTIGANSGFARRLSESDEIKDRGRTIEGFADSGDAKHDELTRAFNEEIISTTPVGETERFIAEDEDGEIHEFDAEVIDLVFDAAKEGELSIEGMRSLGIIAPDFNTTSDVLTDDAIERAQNLQSGEQQNWRMEDGFIIVLCPKCGSEKLYIGGGGLYGCFDCDAEFYFDMNLNDTIF